MTECSAAKPREDLLVRLMADLHQCLDAARRGEPADAELALTQLGRLQNLVELLRRTALQSFGEYEQRVFELSLLRKVGSLFSSVFDRAELTEALIGLVEDTLPCSEVLLYLSDPSTGRLERQCGGRPEPDAAFLAESERHARSVASEQAPAWQPGEGEGHPRAIFSPMIAQGETLGVIGVVEAERGSLQEGAVSTLADLAAIALRHVRLWDEHRRQQVALEERVDERTRQVNEARVALSRQERVAAMGKLAASIAHELNNPMSFMISNLGRAAEHADAFRASLPMLLDAVDAACHLPTADDPRIQRVREAALRANDTARPAELLTALTEFGELIEETRDGADRIRHVGDDMRGFAQGAAGEPELVDVNDLIETAVHVARAEAKNRIGFELRLGPIPQVSCHRYQVIQVLLNLLQNGVEAMEGPGTVRVSTRAHTGFVEVEVADEGAGIEPSQCEHIFEPFYTTKPQGSGLGLSISRDIARAHRGTLDASGGPEGGIFRLRLPVS